jgi:pseudouridine synthase
MLKKIRINKFLQIYNGISRRAADRLIVEGKVKVNGKLAVLGMDVDAEDTVTLNSQRVRPLKTHFTYLLMNKPVGYICSREGEKTVFELIPDSELRQLNYVGRLDVATSGALIFTDDGQFINKILRSNVSRIYIAQLAEPLEDSVAQFLANSPLIDGVPANVGYLQTNGCYAEIELYEGKWREVRRLFKSVGSKVITLHRKSFARITADNLTPGSMRQLNKIEISNLMRLAKLDKRTDGFSY